MLMTLRSVFVLVAALLCVISKGDSSNNNSRIIYNVSDFVAFARDVNNNKANHSGTTIFLAEDLAFDNSSSNDLEMIGGSSTSFCGVFDGQGHTISGLISNKSDVYCGLFGNARDATIKNIVVDDSCVFDSNNHITKNTHVGAIAGVCQGSNSPCVVESIVNMGRVVRRGESDSGTSSCLFMGGIVGTCYGATRFCILRNCANYGNIVVEGSIYTAYIGGLAGKCDSISSPQRCVIQNSLNYGSVDFSASIKATTGETVIQVRIGGLAGLLGNNCSAENCVSAGNVTIKTKNSKLFAGGIAGQAYVKADITHSFMVSGTGYTGMYGYQYSVPNITLSEEVSSVNESVLAGLNNYDLEALEEGGDASSGKWFSNPGGFDVTFYVNGEVFTQSLSAPAFMLPNYTDSQSDTEFDGWYEDPGCTRKISSYLITAGTAFYGKLISNYSTPFKNISYSSSSSSFSSSSSSSSYYSHPPDPIPKHSSSSSSSSSSHPIEPTKTSSSSSDCLSCYVEIIFDKKEMPKEEIEEFVDKFTEDDEQFNITKIEYLPDDTTYTIVRFEDPDRAQNFIDKISAASETKSLVKKVGFAYESPMSLSGTLLSPFFLHCLSFLIFLF